MGPLDPAYPRNRIITRGLEQNGIEVRYCTTSPKMSSRRRWPHLAWQMVRRAELRHADVFFVPEFGQTTVPLAACFSWLLRKPLTVDFFVSHYHAAVFETRKLDPRSKKARYYRAVDQLALRLADRVVVDTPQHEELVVSDFRCPPAKTVVVPIGFDDRMFQPRDDTDGTFRVLFYGSFLALHGVDTIVASAKLLAGEDIELCLVGDGPMRQTLAEDAANHGLDNVHFVPWVPQGAIPDEIAKASVCLGIFGDTPQAHRVVPHKVFQCLAMAKPVITMDSRAIRDLFDAGSDLVVVPPANPPALAAAIRRLRHHPDDRRRLASQGHRKVQEYSPSRLGATLQSAVGHTPA